MSTTTVSAEPFLKAESQLYLDDLEKAIGGYKSADLSAAFGSDFVAGQDALTKKAQEIAESGIGGYQPFLDSAAGFQTQAGESAAAAGQFMGPDAYKAFMSPYQKEIIDTTLSEFDRQTQAGLPSLRNQAIQAGAFGGAREGVEAAEFLTGQSRNRAALQAQLLGQAFGNAQQAAGQAFGQKQNMANLEQNLASGQLGLAGAKQGFLGQDVGVLSTFGSQNQAQKQAELTADQQLAQEQLNQAIKASQLYGSGVTSLISGYPGKTVETTTPTPGAVQTGLSTASTLAGIYRLFNNQNMMKQTT